MKKVRLLFVLLLLWSVPVSANAERIAIVGTGMMGGALGPRLAAAGHSVTYGTRDPAQDHISELLAVSGDSARAVPHQQAVQSADIVIIAVPWKAVEQVVANLAGALENKIVIDITNAISNADDGLPQLVVPTSGGEMVQGWLPNAKVVKAFNTVGFHVVAERQRAKGPVTVPIASDHDDAKARVTKLVEQLGFEPFDAGTLRFSRTLERLAGLYRVPHWSDRRDQSFEYYFRPVPEPTPAEFPVLVRPRP